MLLETLAGLVVFAPMFALVWIIVIDVVEAL
jgi:hypothetical protein